MNNIELTLHLKFDSSIDESLLKELAQNVLDALANEVNTIGLAPESAETFTTNISVSHSGIELTNLDFVSY